MTTPLDVRVAQPEVTGSVVRAVRCVPTVGKRGIWKIRVGGKRKTIMPGQAYLTLASTMFLNPQPLQALPYTRLHLHRRTPTRRRWLRCPIILTILR